MQTVQVNESLKFIKKPVRVRGWVHNLRQMGRVTFIDLRDSTGLLQLVAPEEISLPKVGHEYVIEAEGVVRERDPKFYNDKLASGKIELGVIKLHVISPSEDLPFEVRVDTKGVNEEVRLKYRYLDLRSERMATNLRQRHQIIKFLRHYLDSQSFTEVETPLLTKGTPEGAREFIVPSRLTAGSFYVLPQSPQQFKQLLMVAGLERYYQVAHCLRDEDQRGDRQPEFTQLDMEMSFISQEDILQINEAMLTELIKTLFPHKKINQTPFPRLTYQEAMDKYGTDKPDLRKDKSDPDELAFVWIVDFPMFEINQATSKIDAVHHPFTAPKQEDLALLGKSANEARADAYDVVLNGHEVGGGSIRIHDRKLQNQVFELLGLSQTEIEQRFGHMLEAFSYGVPPHGGIAYGLDRLVMILLDEPNIRETIAFPKTGDARDPLTGAPTPLDEQKLAEAHIQIKKTEKK